MTPSRIHSIRRNKRWQVVTVLGAILVLTLAVSSEFRRIVAIIPTGRFQLVVASQYMGLSIGVGYSTSWTGAAYFKTSTVSAELRKHHTARDRIIPSFTHHSGGPFFHLPYWMFLLVFLFIQYFLLPKSLPATEEE